MNKEHTPSLFDAPAPTEAWTPPAMTTAPASTAPAETLPLPLAHPYARYGLAVALVESRLGTENITEATLRPALIEAIEAGLEKFRMRTPDTPAPGVELKFVPISAADLQNETPLVQSAGLASRGIYLFPSIVTSDGNAKDTHGNALAVLKKLRDSEKLDGIFVLSRSFAPTTAKINNGSSSQSPPKGTLLEAACAIITTLTPLKPAAWPGRNTVIIPDLPLAELRQFIALFQDMSQRGARSDLMSWKFADAPPPKETTRAKSKAKTEAKSKSEFHRPRLHGGNYPHAPRDAGVFGAVGLLGAIGRWAAENRQVERARPVLESLANAPLYIISYDKISQARFGHHIVNLSLEYRLSEMVDALWLRTRLLNDAESPRINRQLPAYQLFYLATSRFLQAFSTPSFSDFLATRVECPALVKPIFEEYFMEKQRIEADIVLSAQAYGQWLNQNAYFAAREEVLRDRKMSLEDLKKLPKEERAKVESAIAKSKARVIVVLESVAMSSKTPQEMLARVQTQTGRLQQQAAPAEAARFFQAVHTGEIETPLPQHLLMTYMRLQPPRKDTGQATAPDAETSQETEVTETDEPGADFPMQDN